MRYDTTQPRMTAFAPYDPETLEQRCFEIGQAPTWGEITFWLQLGYQVEVSNWNGQCYHTQQTYSKEDL